MERNKFMQELFKLQQQLEPIKNRPALDALETVKSLLKTLAAEPEFDAYDIVKKLLGPIEPVGETQADDERYKNLLAMTHLVDKLLFDISFVAGFASCQEHSVSRAGNWAKNFLKEFRFHWTG
jgi:hypothetical protein